ncbi:hypothetical protein [Aromatoleum petrolei]|uniref:hypothetical protein n=1 Tax=Aromatoleum petrolei TaxID=76116 RepID=UPI001AEBD426|nr:hypothetical protein [Aromatoleum petrolei]QTQ36873.1 Uncharacterized protein ToN1_27370 [Aromatoleum petrolei]
MPSPAPQLLATYFALPLAAHADVHMQVEPDGSVTLTDEPHRGFERIVAPPGLASVGRAPIGGTGMPLARRGGRMS